MVTGLLWERGAGYLRGLGAVSWWVGGGPRPVCPQPRGVPGLAAAQPSWMGAVRLPLPQERGGETHARAGLGLEVPGKAAGG